MQRTAIVQLASSAVLLLAIVAGAAQAQECPDGSLQVPPYRCSAPGRLTARARAHLPQPFLARTGHAIHQPHLFTRLRRGGLL
jgi:hypothetical protein